MKDLEWSLLVVVGTWQYLTDLRHSGKIDPTLMKIKAGEHDHALNETHTEVVSSIFPPITISSAARKLSTSSVLAQWRFAFRSICGIARRVLVYAISFFSSVDTIAIVGDGACQWGH